MRRLGHAVRAPLCYPGKRHGGRCSYELFAILNHRGTAGQTDPERIHQQCKRCSIECCAIDSARQGRAAPLLLRLGCGRARAYSHSTPLAERTHVLSRQGRPVSA